MKSVFVLQHCHSVGDDCEDTKLIGVYSSRSTAENALRQMETKLGFAQSDGFSIDEYELDVSHWTDGFVTVEQ
jgi:hypothetical protein